MKEITRIHLAALPYNIEVAAKKDLEVYVDAIRAALNADDEAMKEIESRIAELLAERGVTGEKVITHADVEAVKSQLGDPKEFASDDDEPRDVSVDTETTKPTKRLMRDPANQVLAGVCSGLAAYTGIDAVWVRLGFVVLLFATSGFMIIVYIVMAIVMPEAKTAAERLQMAGKPVTLTALQQEAPAVAKAERDNQIILSTLRGIGGASLLLIAAGTLIGLVAATAQTYSWVFGQSMPVVVAAFATGISGVLFAMFCLVLAMMLFRNSWIKRNFVALGIITILGLVSLGVLTFGAVVSSDDYRASQKDSRVERRIDAAALKGATHATFVANGIDITYHVSADEPYAVIKSQRDDSSKEPWVSSITRDGDGAKIDIRRTGDDQCARHFLGCITYTSMDVYGPALTTIVATDGSVRYMTTAQPELTVQATDLGAVTLASTGAVDMVRAQLAGNGSFDARDANVLAVDMKLADNASAQASTVKTAHVTVPEACKSGDRVRVAIDHASTLQLNGAAYRAETELPCAAVSLNSGE